MEKAKHAVSEFMAKAGHKDTTVHERVAPAVVNETVVKKRHDEIQTAVDREVHQDHFHTTVQPIQDREMLPEQHRHHVAAAQERHIDHGDDAAVRRRLEEERARFHDTRTEGQTIHTQSTAPTVAGEHVHHHVHETIQPVLQKEVIQPTVVHTTVPIHEVHHNAPVHHTASALPAVSLSEYQRQGGTLSGREERIDGFEGEPKAVSQAIGGAPIAGATGAAAPPLRRTGTDSSSDSDREGRLRNTTGTGTRHMGTDGQIGSTNTSAPHHKSNLLNKLDPRVDSNNDGKAGFGK